jgi:antitoxin (DNA-binding transcriptional repressor) of toxin-antitoxin stability system
MRAVGLKILKNKLSEYVRLARSGETILVTDRDQVVAELGPPQAGRSPAAADAVYEQLVRDGVITPAVRPLKGPPPRSAHLIPFAELMRELDEDRADYEPDDSRTD